MKDLFDSYGIIEPKKPDKTCRTCMYRTRWQYSDSASINQYCTMRDSNRTQNGLLKIKVTNKACALYKER